MQLIRQIAYSILLVAVESCHSGCTPASNVDRSILKVIKLLLATVVTSGVPALEACLSASLPESVTVKDPGLQVLALLRVLHGISLHWTTLYHVSLDPCLTFTTITVAKLSIPKKAV